MLYVNLVVEGLKITLRDSYIVKFRHFVDEKNIDETETLIFMQTNFKDIKKKMQIAILSTHLSTVFEMIAERCCQKRRNRRRFLSYRHINVCIHNNKNNRSEQKSETMQNKRMQI